MSSAPPAACRSFQRWWLVQVRIASGKWSSTLVRAVDRASIEGPPRVMKLRP